MALLRLGSLVCGQLGVGEVALLMLAGLSHMFWGHPALG